ncbi:hypothetical protein UFOVP150_62 [uncultured Caudovirales phage]|uniref:Uncharacterized protein n=1 Tax=uncultured Caudovirales phage TaxID=2100421 RepID=A0A6J7WE17_9CAUD|nr:hypothetical protein UFOVP150_62 [uncultured Caudovirales phage]
MLKFIGGVALSIFILGVLGINVEFKQQNQPAIEKTQEEVDADSVTSALNHVQKLMEFQETAKQAQMMQDLLDGTLEKKLEQDRSQTVSEDPNASGGSVSVQDYYSAVQQ